MVVLNLYVVNPFFFECILSGNLGIFFSILFATIFHNIVWSKTFPLCLI